MIFKSINETLSNNQIFVHSNWQVLKYTNKIKAQTALAFYILEHNVHTTFDLFWLLWNESYEIYSIVPWLCWKGSLSMPYISLGLTLSIYTGTSVARIGINHSDSIYPHLSSGSKFHIQCTTISASLTNYMI